MPKYIDDLLVLDQAIFIMSPPRSGSTLFRNMLNGHPKLYSPPELYLLPYDTMKQRATASRNKPYLKKGLIQTFAEVYDVSYQEAETLAEGLEKQNASTIEVYALIQSQIGDATLVDKTPNNVTHLSNFLMAIERFNKPVFFHLYRHPYSSIDSHLKQTARKFKAKKKTFGKVRHKKFQLEAEAGWLACHMHALKLQDLVPKNRYIQVCYESLVENPEHEMRRICKKLNLRFSRGMLDPYKDSKKMYKAILKNKNEEAQKYVPLGDPGFYEHDDIDIELALKWRDLRLPQSISEATSILAESMGYELPEFEPEFRYLNHSG
jgi:hypothetical protein